MVFPKPQLNPAPMNSLHCLHFSHTCFEFFNSYIFESFWSSSSCSFETALNLLHNFGPIQYFRMPIADICGAFSFWLLCNWFQSKLMKYQFKESTSCSCTGMCIKFNWYTLTPKLMQRTINVHHYIVLALIRVCCTFTNDSPSHMMLDYDPKIGSIPLCKLTCFVWNRG